MTVLAAAALVFQTAPLSSFAVYRQEVDTIMLETEAEDSDDVAVDISWKTEQDNGRWIDEMGIGDDVTSLILVVNNINKDSGEDYPDADETKGSKPATKKRNAPGNSRMYYMSRSEEGGWKQIFSVNCVVSGGPEENEAIYGAYRLESTFGNRENPGSLTPYHKLSSDDYWIMDESSDNYLTIVHEEVKPESEQAINLELMKAFFNYGMILRPEEEGDAYPALLVSCQQADTVDRTVSGIQLAESYVRMLIQGIDGNTRIMIAGEIEDFEGM